MWFWSLRSLQQKKIPEILLGSKAQLALKADNLIVNC
jgi:hypothetical protein